MEPGDKYFKNYKIGERVYWAHPFACVINAKYIEKDLTYRHLTTLENKIKAIMTKDRKLEIM